MVAGKGWEGQGRARLGSRKAGVEVAILYAVCGSVKQHLRLKQRENGRVRVVGMSEKLVG